jgi:hypothetical protein
VIPITGMSKQIVEVWISISDFQTSQWLLTTSYHNSYHFGILTSFPIDGLFGFRLYIPHKARNISISISISISVYTYPYVQIHVYSSVPCTFWSVKKKFGDRWACTTSWSTAGKAFLKGDAVCTLRYFPASKNDTPTKNQEVGKQTCRGICGSCKKMLDSGEPKCAMLKSENFILFC